MGDFDDEQDNVGKEFAYEPQTTLAMAEIQRKLDDFSRWRLEVDDIIIPLEHDLKGEKFDPKTQTWVPEDLRLLNDEGVKSIISLVRTVSNKTVYLTYLEKAQIYGMCLDLNKQVAKLLFFRWQDFDVKEEHLSMLVFKIVTFVFMGMKRAEDAGERKALTQSEKIVRRYGDENKKGPLGGILSFGRRKET